MSPADERAGIGRARDGHDAELAGRVLAGGVLGEYAGLELLLRRWPESWQDAVALVKPTGVPPRSAVNALAHAWRTYRRTAPTTLGGGE